MKKIQSFLFLWLCTGILLVGRTTDIHANDSFKSQHPIQTQDITQTTKTQTELKMEQAGLIDIAERIPGIQVSLMYARADNFTGKVLYQDLHRAYLHPQAAKALGHAQELLQKQRPDLSLKVYDAARPMHIQQTMWNSVAGTSKSIYVSNPRNGGGLHNYGMAVDVTLCRLNSDTLDMGTVIDHLGQEAHIDQERYLVEQKIISQEALKNRLLLRKVMTQAGFRPLRTEWWHFNFISRATAKAKYKPIP